MNGKLLWLSVGLVLLGGCSSTPEVTPSTTEEPPRLLQVGVTRVVEGDILQVVDSEERTHTIRLRGVDAPEPDQPYGEGARRCLEELVLGRSVLLSANMRPLNDMLVSEVYLRATPVSKLLVHKGCAWWDQQSAPYDLRLGHIENSARQARRGLWVDRSPVAPWEWRAGSGRP
ncbi:hypothetical protein FV139_11275 [Parahaliea maris]|uniref:TNase-like domain-containing protein n=1 Tax=Parahaliea maris TaxID=2716870 RepID=A0A5C9A4N3_9GAMM|nr:thermonuclease family protein [Parahaliea maris]TXS94171.1 hypothetical protein FV139_11275 [Parahaliea maris]